LVEEAGKVDLWRCERFFGFGKDTLKQPMYGVPGSKPVEDMRKSYKKREATIVVNGALPTDHRLNACWNPAHVRICADGGSNRLFKVDKEKYIPDHIVGDLDSSTKEVLEHYKKKGVAVVHDPDQESSDLHKALNLVKKIEILPNGVFDTISILGGLGGCFTHEMSNVNCLYQLLGKKAFLVSPGNVACVLPKGKHLIRIYKKPGEKDDDDHGSEESIDESWQPPKTVYCGMIPLGHKCTNVITKGLRWDLKQQTLEFGGMVSSSNEFLHNVAEIDVSHPILWTFDFRDM